MIRVARALQCNDQKACLMKATVKESTNSLFLSIELKQFTTDLRRKIYNLDQLHPTTESNIQHIYIRKGEEGLGVFCWEQRRPLIYWCNTYGRGTLKVSVMTGEALIDWLREQESTDWYVSVSGETLWHSAMSTCTESPY